MRINELHILLGIALVVGTVYLLKCNRRPPSDSFVCARYRKPEEYSPRTIDAWYKGYNNFFCRDCHNLWLDNNYERKREYRRAASAGGGRLGILVFLAALPSALYVRTQIHGLTEARANALRRGAGAPYATSSPARGDNGVEWTVVTGTGKR